MSRPTLLATLAVALGLLACCRPPQDPPRDGILHEDQTFAHDGEQRTYHLYEPADTAAPRPLVLLLHGGGATIDNHIGIGNADWPHRLWLDIADEDPLFVLVPQGIDAHWNDCRADCEHCGDHDDAGFLLALIDELAGAHPIDLDRVYAVGESNGGFMTQRLARHHPDRFAAMGVVVALLPADNGCDAAVDAPISVMYQVGTADLYIPYEGGQSSNPSSGSVLSAAATLDHWIAVNQCEPVPTTSALPDLDPDDGSTATRADHACPATATTLSMITFDGGGHVPSSVEVQVGPLWEALVGEQNHDVEGARVFWGFFRGR